MPRIHFEYTVDNAQAVSSINDMQRRYAELAKTMEKISKEEGIDMSKAANQMLGLKTAINNNIGAFKQYSRELKELQIQLREAAAAGNVDLAKQLNEQISEVSGKMQEAQNNVRQYRSALETLTGKTSEQVGLMQRLAGSTENYNRILANLPPGLRMVVQEFNGLKRTLDAILQLPLAPFIFAAAVAFSSLHQWLTKSADGQREFARLTGYVNSVVASLRDVMIDLGREIGSAFKDNLPLLRRFAEYIAGIAKVAYGTGKVVNASITGFFSHLFSGNKNDDFFSDKIREGLDLIESGKDLFKGEGTSDLDKRAKRMSELAVQEEDLARKRKAWSVEEAKLEEEKSKEEVKMRSARSQADRKAAAARVKELNDKKYEKELEFAEEELAIVREMNSLHENEQKDYDREAELAARVHQLRAQQNRASSFAARIESNADRQMEAAGEQEREQRLTMERAFIKKRLQLQREGEALIIAGMEEGFEKEKKELDNEHSARMAKINEDYEDQVDRVRKLQESNYKRISGGSLAGFKFDENDPLLGKAKENRDKQLENENLRDANARAAQLKKYLDEYKSFVSKWEEQTKRFSDTKAFLEAANANDDAINTLANKERDAMTSLAKQWASSGWDEAFQRWAEELAGQSLVDLHIMLNDLEGELAIIGDVMPTDEVAQMSAKVLLLKDAIKNFKSENVDTKKILDNWTELNKVLAGSAKVFKQVGDAIGGTFGEALSMLGNFATSVGQVGLGIQRLKEINKKDNPLEAFAAGLSVTSSVLSVVGELYANIKASVENTKQLDLATQAYGRTLKSIRESRLLSTYDNVFGEDSFGKFLKQFEIAADARKNLKDTIGAISDEYKSAFGELFNGSFVIQSDMRTGWQKLIGSQKNIFNSLMSDFIDDEGNILGDELKEWVKTYGDGMATETRNTVEKILAEWDRLQEAEEGVKSFLGSIFDNVADDVADKMLDKFIQTGDAIVDMTEYMDNFGQSVAKSIIKGQLIDKVFNEKARNDIASLLSNGDEGSVAKAIEMYNTLLNEANEQAPAIQKFLEGVNLDRSSITEGGTSGSFQGMSQAMGSALEGRFTAVQIAAETIAERMVTNMTIMTAMSNYMAGSNTTLSEIRDAHIREVGYLEDIARQTRPLSTLVSVGDKLDIIASKL